MVDVRAGDAWEGGSAYEQYVGRWSALVAKAFLEWLALPPGLRWLDVGCGTGALSKAILAAAPPGAVVGIDRSKAQIAFARHKVDDPRADFQVGDAQALPIESAAYDVAVSGLVLNFVPKPPRMLAEMARAVRASGTVAVYVWDYAGKMELMRYFWDAVATLQPSAHELDEGARFPICRPDALATSFRDAGLDHIETKAIEIPTDFRDFDDYWSPFLGGQGPGPRYVMSLHEADRANLRDRLRASLPIRPDGSIHLTARAWAARGQRK